MAVARISGVRIVGVSAVVPKNIKTTADLASIWSAEDAEKIASSIGVNKRHIAGDNVCTSDLCYEAAMSLLAECKWPSSSIDAVVFVSQTPDYILPATACVLHGRLNCSKQCVAFDINQGCSGYVYGLWTLMSLMSASGMKRALLLAGDTLSKIVAPKDRSSVPVFGDAGTATILELDATAGGSIFSLGADGSGWPHLIVPAGGFRRRSTPETALPQEKEGGNIRSEEDLYMNGTEVFSFTLREVPAMISLLLDEARLAIDDVDYFIFHQANAFIIKHLVKKMKLPKEKVPITMGDFGNTSSASIPLSLCVIGAGGRLGKGSRTVLTGFGVGFSWGSALVDMSQAVLLPVRGEND